MQGEGGGQKFAQIWLVETFNLISQIDPSILWIVLNSPNLYYSFPSSMSTDKVYRNPFYKN